MQELLPVLLKDSQLLGVLPVPTTWLYYKLQAGLHRVLYSVVESREIFTSKMVHSGRVYIQNKVPISLLNQKTLAFS